MNISTGKKKKCTHMSAATLRAIRLEMGFDMRSMARVLNGMPYRTYQDYEYGNRGIPKHVAEAVKEIRRRDRQYMKALPRRIQTDIDRRYPEGIPSEPDRETREAN